jgi:group I intron endonuclease
METTGIYKITNIINNKFYIGSASLGFERRFIQHKSDLKQNKHRNIHLQRSYNKHGKDNFIFEIIEYCEPLKCIEREQYYIDTLKPNFNINLKAQSCLGVKRTLEQRKRISKANRGRPAWNKGIPFNKEVRQKMSESRKEGLKKGTVKSWNKGKKCPRDKIILRNDGKIYPNVMTAAIDLNVKENTIIKACTDKKKVRTVRGFVLKYQ